LAILNGDVGGGVVVTQPFCVNLRQKQVSVGDKKSVSVVDLMLVVNGDFAFVENGEGLYLFLIGKLL
jgi:hypothetical protein